MAVYRLSEKRIESIIRATKRLRLCYCAVAAGILVAAWIVGLTRPEWIFGPHQQARVWVVLALGVFVAGPLADTVLRWQSRPVKLRKLLRDTQVTLNEQGIEVSDANSVRRFMRSEILGAEEVSWGVYLRSANRYRWILVSSQIDEFNEFKAELRRLSIPITAAGIPPNCEELAGALAFVAIMLCAVFARSAAVLTADLVLSVIVAVIGFAVISANPENLGKMRWARFGIFLPVAMTGSMLWTALQ
jgi:uncharacterized membrane protein YphA (DoxX/SURF4 family)